MSYDLETGEILELEEKDVPAGKRTRGANATSTPFHLPAIPVVYQCQVSRASMDSVQRYYDEYDGVYSGFNEASLEAVANDVSLEKLLWKAWLCGQAAHT